MFYLLNFFRVHQAHTTRKRENFCAAHESEKLSQEIDAG
jgi:hypothetical protein